MSGRVILIFKADFFLSNFGALFVGVRFYEGERSETSGTGRQRRVAITRETIARLLRGRQDKLPIPTAARAHPLRCSLGQRPLWASSLVRASRLHPWRSSLYVSYPTIPSVPSPPGAEREYFQRAGLNALSSIPNGGEGRGEEDFQTASFRLRRFDTFTQTQSSICCESQTRGPADSGSVSRSTVELRDRFPGVRKP